MKKSSIALTVLLALSATSAYATESDTKDSTMIQSKVKNYYKGEVTAHTDSLYQYDLQTAPGRINNK